MDAEGTRDRDALGSVRADETLSETVRCRSTGPGREGAWTLQPLEEALRLFPVTLGNLLASGARARRAGAGGRCEIRLRRRDPSRQTFIRILTVLSGDWPVVIAPTAFDTGGPRRSTSQR